MGKKMTRPKMENAFTAALIPLVAQITGDLTDIDIAESAANAVLASPSAVPMLIDYAQAGQN